jgi:hypothetical protein
LVSIEFDIYKFKLEVDILCLRGVSFLDSVLTICDKNGIDLETISPIIKKDPELKSRAFLEAEKLNYIKKTSPELPDFEETDEHI